MSNRIFVIGYINPDTGTIASALGYAWLPRQRDNVVHDTSRLIVSSSPMTRVTQ